MEQELQALGFSQAGQIVINDVDKLVFSLRPEFIGAGIEARRCGWVYLWVRVHLGNGTFEVVYVGKAGNSLRNRCLQHESGFVNHPTGRRHADRIRQFLGTAADNHRMQLFARKALDVELLGESGISMCEAEERAMIAKCLRRNIQLWNYQASLPREPENGNPVEAANQAEPVPPAPIEQVAIANAPVTEDPADADDGDQQDLSRQDAFFASVANIPYAQAAVAGLLNALSDRHDVAVHYTFTNGADLRIRKLTERGRDIIVARIWWQRSNGGYASDLYLNPDESIALGATAAAGPREGDPSNVRSHAFFAIPGTENALVAAMLGCIGAFDRDNGQ